MAEMEWRSRVRLVDEVVAVLRDRIYEGHFAPGAPLRQEQLAAELRVSRTPLREALRMLEREGLVKVEPGRGVRVISADDHTLLDAYELREVIDGLAARLAAQRRTEATLGRLSALLERQHASLEPWDPGAYTATNVAFHTEIIAAAGNEFVSTQLPLVPLTSQIFVPVKRVDRSRAERAVAEHEGIRAAIAAQEPEEAERLARAHIRTTIDTLVPHRDAEAGMRTLEAQGADGALDVIRPEDPVA